jgi:Xaa-Pro aminopeptidase
MVGNPGSNRSLYRAIQFLVHDPVALVELPDGSRTLILREIEIDRASRDASVDRVAGYGEFAPEEGLSGDRGTVVAQVAAECLRRGGVSRVIADRTLPLLVTRTIEEAGIEVVLDADIGVADRRVKDSVECENLRHAQSVTEAVMNMACTTVGLAEANDDGSLLHDGQPLTSERLRAMIDTFLLERNFSNAPSIVAGGPQGSDCHDLGSGPLRTGEPVIIDIFPMDRATLYNGDCTRTVVNGTIPTEIKSMHAAVVAAKAAATAAVRPGISGEAIHLETLRVLAEHGFGEGQPSMPHGTGHGIGLDVHESPLLDRAGPDLLQGDVLTIEPGLYASGIGGVRVEDMVLVTRDGCENFNRLPQDLSWS